MCFIEATDSIHTNFGLYFAFFILASLGLVLALQILLSILALYRGAITMYNDYKFIHCSYKFQMYAKHTGACISRFQNTTNAFFADLIIQVFHSQVNKQTVKVAAVILSKIWMNFLLVNFSPQKTQFRNSVALIKM